MHRWAVILQAYDFDIANYSGKTYGNAEGVFRLPVNIAVTNAAHKDAEVSAFQQ